MTLSEFLNKIGDENYTFQILNHSLLNSKLKKDGNEITFISRELSPGDIAAGSEKIGLVV